MIDEMRGRDLLASSRAAMRPVSRADGVGACGQAGTKEEKPPRLRNGFGLRESRGTLSGQGESAPLAATAGRDCRVCLPKILREVSGQVREIQSFRERGGESQNALTDSCEATAWTRGL